MVEKVKVLTPDNSKAQDLISSKCKSIFLAGTIDNGAAENWQDKAIEYIIKNYKGEEPICIINPRGKNWDPSIPNSIDDARFFDQVNWEQIGLFKSTRIVFNFLPGSQSIISCLEFGQYGESDKLAVCCPDTYHKKGNIEFMCKVTWSIPLFDNIEKTIDFTIQEL